MSVARKKSYYCGDRHVECEIYFISSHAYLHRGPRNRTGRRTSEKQYHSNQRNSLKKLRRIIKSNFATGKDRYLSMTYNNRFLPEDDESAVKEARDFRDRLQGLCERRNIECRLLIVTERGKLNGRLHHHAFVNSDVPTDLIRKAWSKKKVKEKGYPKESIGKIHIDKVPTDVDNLECISEYTLKCPIGKHKWIQTRNLKQPETEVDDATVSPGEFAQLGYGGFDRNEMYLMLSELYPDYTPIDYDGMVIEALNNSPYMTASLELKNKPQTVEAATLKRLCDKYNYKRNHNCRIIRNRKLIRSAVDRWIMQKTDTFPLLNTTMNEDCREFMVKHMAQFIHKGMDIDRAIKEVDRQVASQDQFSHVVLTYIGLRNMRKGGVILC